MGGKEGKDVECLTVDVRSLYLYGIESYLLVRISGVATQLEVISVSAKTDSSAGVTSAAANLAIA